MILTYKIKHNLDLTEKLVKARKVAEFAIANPYKLSTKYVKHFGLSSVISNPILRKYGKNKKIKKISSVVLPINGKYMRKVGLDLYIPCLKALIPLRENLYIKFIELDKDYIYIRHEVTVSEGYKVENHIGVDMNTTGHCAVVAIKETGKVYKLGKKAYHIRKKYRSIHKKLRRAGKFIAFAKIKRRESNIIRDLNHKISRKIIDIAIQTKGGVQLEKLENIRKSKVKSKSFRYALNSWSYYQLGQFIEYKALLAGVPISYVAPAYTSKACSRCGLVGDRQDKSFKCPKGHVENADVNAAFNIAMISDSILKLQLDRDSRKGRTARPQKEIPESTEALKLSN